MKYKDILSDICGLVVLPIIAAVPLLLCGVTKYNYTGILNLPGVRPWAVGLGLFYGLMIFLLLEDLHHAKTNVAYIVLWVLGILTPYTKGSVVGQFHLLFGTVGTIVLQLCLLPLWHMDKTITRMYACTCLLAIMIVITFCAVTGLAEIAYAVPLPILLTLLKIKKDRRTGQ